MTVHPSRRQALGLLGLGAAAGAGGVGGISALRADSPPESEAVPFHGAHQAGVITPVQGYLHFMSFDLTTGDRTKLVALMRRWTSAAEQLTAGRPIGDTGALRGPPVAPPDDTGEALGLGPSRLTLTLGLGRSLFDDRFGLSDARPAPLVELPGFAGDTLEAGRSGGDLCVQACADEPQVAVHAVRNLTRLAAGTAATRWSQLGFGRASSTSAAEQTPRNLFGFKDGTANITAEQTAELDRHVWVQPFDTPAWMSGGSYLVARQIRMLVETWDRTSLAEQEQIIGRTKGEGAPLGATQERDPVHPASLPAGSHVRLAHPSGVGGARLLRRGFNTTDGLDQLGHLDAGLFFLAYQRDIRTGFIPVQQSLAGADMMNEYIRHVGSSVWAIPPGTQPGGWWAESLLS